MTGGGRQGSERADVGGTSWSLAGPPAPPLGLTSAVSLSELGEFVQQVEANQTLFDRRPWAADLETWEAADGLKADVIASHHALQVRLPTDGGLPPARNQRDAMQVDKTGVAISLVPCPPPPRLHGCCSALSAPSIPIGIACGTAASCWTQQGSEAYGFCFGTRRLLIYRASTRMRCWHTSTDVLRIMRTGPTSISGSGQCSSALRLEPRSTTFWAAPTTGLAATPGL